MVCMGCWWWVWSVWAVCRGRGLYRLLEVGVVYVGTVLFNVNWTMTSSQTVELPLPVWVMIAS